MSEAEIRKEQEVIERSKKDPQAFGEIYEHYFDRIFNYVYRQTDDEELAGDLCSQTFVNALNHLHKYEFRGFPFSAWLYKIAGNEVNKHYRKSKGKKVFSIEELKVKELVEQASDEWDEEMVTNMCKIDSTFRYNLSNSIWKNTVKEQYWFEDMSYEDIIAGKWKELT